TNKRREIMNITEKIREYVKKHRINNGFVIIFLPHATAAIFANEDEENIKKDYLNLLEKLVPENGNYYHNKIDNNADSHLLSSLFKQFYIIPIKNNDLYLGTWQEIFLLELDGPRKRRVFLTIIGE
ncbi:MAG: secondary thiamine-phosphate synthase enzyme YjbQ, partial [Nanopusillaceae archaeon]